MVVLVVSSWFYPGWPQRAEGAGADEGVDGSVADSWASRFMAESDRFWQQLLSSAFPKALVSSSPQSTGAAWAATIAQMLFRMRLSTPTSFLALAIPALRTVPELAEEEYMLPASDPDVPPLVTAEEPASPEAQAQGWTYVPEMLIYHTHNIESFVPTSGKTHVYDNQDQTIVRVGSKLAEELSAAGVSAVHSKADNSSKDWINAYSTSLKTISGILQKQPSIEYVFDLHRDAGARSATTTVIEGQSTARIYLVVGTNTTLGHPNYQKNIEFAQRLNDKLNELYPGLSRGIRVTSRSRYNQHVREKALLIEVGGEQNTMDEALRAAGFLAKAIVAVAKDLQTTGTP